IARRLHVVPAPGRRLVVVHLRRRVVGWLRLDAQANGPDSPRGGLVLRARRAALWRDRQVSSDLELCPAREHELRGSDGDETRACFGIRQAEVERARDALLAERVLHLDLHARAVTGNAYLQDVRAALLRRARAELCGGDAPDLRLVEALTLPELEL